MPLAPPPEATYNHLYQAEETVLKWARQEGYAVVELRLKKSEHKDPNMRVKRKVWMICDKGGKPQLAGTSRNTSIRKTDCPFQLTITRNHVTMKWTIAILNSEHNHGPSGDASAHPAHRKRALEELDLIKSISKSRISPKHILLALQEQDPETAVCIQDIYNERTKLRKEELGELTPTEALCKMLFKTGSWVISYEKGEDGCLNKLFFAHATGIQLAQNYPYMLLFDCTYRMNQYNMPLLHAAGVALTGEAFSIAFAFMSQENAIQYQWVAAQFKEFMLGDREPDVIITDNEDALLTALDSIYPRVPRILCRWHIKKNVLTAAQ